MTARSYFITGASSGIGLEVSRLLHARGDLVIATGRRPRKDLPADFPDVAYHPADLADHRQRNDVLDLLPPHLDRAIHCAGHGHYRVLMEDTAPDISQTVAVNLAAAIHFAHGLYKPLSAVSGRMAFVGSVARAGAGKMPVYATTKAALDGLAPSLALEWHGRIIVKALHPGPTATGISVRAGRPADLLDRMMLSPQAVAAAIVTALEDKGGYRSTISYGRVLTDRVLRRHAR